MKTPITSETDLVDRVIAQDALRKPIQKASTAASMVRDVVARSVAYGYERHDPIWFASREYWSKKKEYLHQAAFVWSCSSPFIFIAAAVAASQAGLIAVTAALFLAFPLLCLAPMLYVASGTRATAQFAFASNKLSSATARLPTGPVKTLFQKLVVTAKRVFALGQISAIQEQIGAGGKSPRQLRKLQETGLNLIDKAVKDSRLGPSESRKLREAFKKGQLSKPQKYVRLLDEQQKQLQDALNTQR